MFRIIAATITAFALLALPAAAQDLPAHYRVTDVAANDVLNIRAEPRASAPILGHFRPDESRIEVTALSPDGRWGRVNSGEQAGWAAMRYLSRETLASWRDGEMALSCFGTEPFWHMPIFLPSHRAEFHAAGEGGFELVTEAGNLPGTQFPPTLAIPFSGTRDGMAVLRGASCSDGMSDMLFGLEVQIYWRGGYSANTGCCSLQSR